MTSIGVGKPHWRLTEERSMMRVVEYLQVVGSSTLNIPTLQIMHHAVVQYLAWLGSSQLALVAPGTRTSQATPMSL
jgi:hypothetical protein